MSVYILTFLIGVVSGLRSMTPLTVVSWTACAGHLHLENTWLAFLGFAATPYILTVLAIAELIADKLPKTPSRKAPVGFSGRIVTGALSGAALGVAGHAMRSGLILGILGSIVGTLGGYALRVRLVRASGGRDLPIALLEDAVSICGSILIVLLL